MDTPTGAERIATERQRQIDVEGWTPEHDAEHEDGALLGAAIYYAIVGATGALADTFATGILPVPGWVKFPEDPDRALVIAGALIAAELDRRTVA